MLISQSKQELQELHAQKGQCPTEGPQLQGLQMPQHLYFHYAVQREAVVEG